MGVDLGIQCTCLYNVAQNEDSSMLTFPKFALAGLDDEGRWIDRVWLASNPP